MAVDLRDRRNPVRGRLQLFGGFRASNAAALHIQKARHKLRGTWPQVGGAAARLGSAEGDRLVDPGTPPEEPRNRLRPKRPPHSKKARGCGCRGGRKTPRQTDRGFRHGRAPHRPKAGYAPSLGARRRSPDRTWPSPVRLAVRHGLRITGYR
jgi:hypothetical protein